MSAQSPETFLDVAFDYVIIADTDEATTSVDLKGYLGVLWVVNVTDISADSVLVKIEDSANDSTWADALQPDGTTVATMGSAAIVANGVYYFRALAENVDRYARLNLAVTTDGIDATVVAIKYGPSVAAAMGETEGTAGHLQIALP